MDFKTSSKCQTWLLLGGFAVAAVGVWGLDNTFLTLLGLGMMVLSILVWWLYFRCPYCREQLGRGRPKRCPHCGAWLGDEPEPEEKKKIQHRKKKR